MAVAAENCVSNVRLTADATIGPDHGAVDHGIFFNLRLPPDHGVWADLRAGLDQCAFVDETGALDRGALLDARIGSDPGTRRRNVAKRLGRIPPVHDVAVYLRVLPGRADVDPVAVIDVGDERLSALDERRKIAAFD